MKDYLLDQSIKGLAILAGIAIPSDLSLMDLKNYKVPLKDGLPDYTNFDDKKALIALDELCKWFEKLDKESNQNQIEKIAKAISDNVRGPGKIYNFFVKVIHHDPSFKRLQRTGVIKYIGANPELVEPLMGIVKGQKVDGVPNLLELEVAQKLFDVHYEDKEAYYNARSSHGGDDSPDSKLSSRSASLSSLSNKDSKGKVQG